MRLSFIFIFAALMQVNASSKAQKITLSKSNTSLKLIIKELRIQSGFGFVYTDNLLKKAGPVSLNVKNAALEDVLNLVLDDIGLTFSIDNSTVIIEPKKQISFLNDVKEKVTDFFYQDSIVFKGRIVDDKGVPLMGATIRNKGGNKVSIATAPNGYFEIVSSRKGTIIINYVGYVNKEINLAGLNPKEQIIVNMVQGQEQLGQVDIVSTGYQDIPKERATGSFEVITKEQLKHSNNPNLLKRLEGITTSMDFNNQLRPINSANVTGLNARATPLQTLTIRGRNTLGAFNTATDIRNGTNTSGQVLVVIDGIASPYSIDQINPDDIETITILKDAAAASVWGSRAANGVIVIKSKKGIYNTPVRISFNANFNITQKLNLYYFNYMSISDYVDAQVFAFNQPPGINMPAPSNLAIAQTPFSPVAEILNQFKLGTITEAQKNAQLDVLRGNDIRRDYNKYLSREAVNKNYSLNISGGSKKVNYYLSVGQNNSLKNTYNADEQRTTITYSASANPIKNLGLSASASYMLNKRNDQAPINAITGALGGGSGASFYPYSDLADDQGNFLNIARNYRSVFLDLVESTYGDKVLSLRWKPLEDMNEGYNKGKDQTLNILVNANYKLLKGISANVTYNYATGRSEANVLYRQNSFYMRETINKYTSRTDFSRAIPLGGQLTTDLGKTANQTLRGLLNFDFDWKKHAISGIVGTDFNQVYSVVKTDIYLGYNEKTLTYNNNLDFQNSKELLFIDPVNGLGSSTLPRGGNAFSNYRTRAAGVFSNAAYTYDKKYTISASIRQDLSSEFGAGTNMNAKPFYHLGGSWTINNEKFYNFSLIPSLRMRGSFGYNGNVNPQLSRPLLSYTTYGDYTGGTGLYYAFIGSVSTQGVANSLLRPEKSRMMNIGLDFGFRGNRLSGSLEYYNRKTIDMLAPNVLDPSSGFTTLSYNTANLSAKGVDFTFNSVNFQNGKIRWNSGLLLSYNRTIVTKLYSAAAKTAQQVIAGVPGYNEGYDISRIFAYKWAGLDPETGDPRGYLNGQPVTINNTTAGVANYSAVANAPLESARYFGSASPVVFGSIRNGFSYKQFSVSANVMYKLGYYFRKPNAKIVRYNLLFAGNMLQGEEYAQRWQKPGDELITNVPSFNYDTGSSSSRDNFYYFSELSVLKADHIRLQELNFSYTISKKNWFLKNPTFYANLPLNVMIWTANKEHLDPEVFDYPTPKTYSFGFSASF